uniref:Thioredoxin domain-containing protein n=1 Tax=viral metagenome TaxID=1070528 RepID=A0A6C0AC38_9ZZZZ
MNLNNTDMIKYGILFVMIALIAYIVYINYFNSENVDNRNQNNQIENNKNENENKIANDKLTVVLYKQKTCSHCIDFIPTWIDLQKKFNNLGISHKTVECTEEDCDGIQYIPTIRIFKEDDYVEYKGDRTQKNILDFISKL